MHTILFLLPFISNPISSQFHTYDGRGWMISSSGGPSCSFPVSLGSDGWYGWGNEMYTVDFRFWIESYSWRVSWCFRSLYISDILWNKFQAILGSLCVSRLFINLDTFTNLKQDFFISHSHIHFYLRTLLLRVNTWGTIFLDVVIITPGLGGRIIFYKCC